MHNSVYARECLVKGVVPEGAAEHMAVGRDLGSSAGSWHRWTSCAERAPAAAPVCPMCAPHRAIGSSVHLIVKGPTLPRGTRRHKPAQRMEGNVVTLTELLLVRTLSCTMFCKGADRTMDATSRKPA